MTVTHSQGLPYGDGSTKIHGMENFGNTCYCNSILQCLYYTTKFRTELLQYNSVPHERKLTTPGTIFHSFTGKYETLVAKRLREQGKVPPPAEAGSNGSAPAKPSIRGSIFGKFSSNSTPTTNSIGDFSHAQYKRQGYIQEAGSCGSLSMEQRLIIRKTPDFHKLDLLVTRPTTASTTENKTDNSTSSTALLDSGNNANSVNSASEAGPITSRSGYVVIGIPYPETNLINPINPFNANPSADQRKRSALINGPILNLDHSLTDLTGKPDDTCLLYALKDIFESMVENKSQIGVVSPYYFVNKLKEKNFLFRQANMHHDAHEFCNYMINETIESVNLEMGNEDNWCRDIFEGQITNETKCLSCETVTSKVEPFLDLSIDIPPGESAYSLTYSLNNFSKLETLNHQNKFYCNTCSSLQEAVKTIKLKKTPEVLVINFKRFKYDDKLDRMVKLFDSISYPLKLRLFNTTSQSNDNPQCQANPDFSLYGLYALVIHIGGGPMHGHYVALCKCQAGLWFLFDDETIELVDESYVLRFFGNGPGLASAYILFYEKLDTKLDEYDLDLGIDLHAIYNGSDYSLATLKPRSATPLSYPVTDVSPSTSPEIDSVKEFVPGSMENSVTSVGRKTSIFKKNFMFDSGAIGEVITKSVSRSSSIKDPNSEVPPATGKSPAKAHEKKSWVNGLKRRELKAEILPFERKSSQSSVKTTGSTKSTGGSDKETGEKEKRRGSIFSLRRRNKS